MITPDKMEATRTSWLLGTAVKMNLKYEEEVFRQKDGCDKVVDLKGRCHLK